MKNCADCVSMRVRIPIVDGSRKRGMIVYRNGIARCVKGVLVYNNGKEMNFRTYGNRHRPKYWDEAEHCDEYNTGDEIVSHELADAVVSAYRIVHGK